MKTIVKVLNRYLSSVLENSDTLLTSLSLSDTSEAWRMSTEGN